MNTNLKTTKEFNIKDLRNGDIIVVDHSQVDTGVPGVIIPTCAYIVMENIAGRKKVAVSFIGDVGCGDRPTGWYSLAYDDDKLPTGTVAIYRPTHLGRMFSGNFDDRDYYDLLAINLG